jgi:hypothetical protein
MAYSKISGAFRTAAGLETFCTICAYLATLHKQGDNLFPALTLTFPQLSGAQPLGRIHHRFQKDQVERKHYLRISSKSLTGSSSLGERRSAADIRHLDAFCLRCGFSSDLGIPVAARLPDTGNRAS